MKQVKEYLEKYSALLPVGSNMNYQEAERRAGEFLTALATITDWRHAFGQDKIRCISAQTAVYAQELSKGTAKTVTENKVTAEASEAYTAAREELERIENDLNYLKAYYDIFNNAHIFYRNVSKSNDIYS